MTPSQESRLPSDEPDVDVERALASVARPAARPEFKAKLRQTFLSVQRHDAKTPLYDVVEDPRPARSTPRSKRWVWTGLAAAAAIVVLLLLAKPSESRWKLIDAPPAAFVYVNGVAIRGDDRARLEASLAEAREIRTEERLRLRFGDWFVLELAPHSRAALSPPEQRTRPEPLTWQVLEGSLRMRTGPALHGEELHVATDEVSVRVTGTTFAAEVVKDGTCICCLEGRLMAALPKSQSFEPVDGNRTFHVYRDGSTPKRDAINPAHVPPLRELDEVAHALWP